MLNGKTVLVVETEIIISLSMEAVLRGLGASDVVMVTSPDEFHRRVQSWSGVSLAILEIEARRPDHIDLAKSALDRGIPVMALTADSQYRQGIPGLPGMPVLVKPVPDETLSTAIFEFIGDPAIRTSDCQT